MMVLMTSETPRVTFRKPALKANKAPVAMATGDSWAFLAGFPKLTRAVSHVLPPIMLNYIAPHLVAYFLQGAALKVGGRNAPRHRVRAIRSRSPSGSVPGAGRP